MHKGRGVPIGWALHLVSRANLLSSFAQHFVVVSESCSHKPAQRLSDGPKDESQAWLAFQALVQAATCLS